MVFSGVLSASASNAGLGLITLFAQQWSKVVHTYGANLGMMLLGMLGCAGPLSCPLCQHNLVSLGVCVSTRGSLCAACASLLCTCYRHVAAACRW
jgi:hypothetical protein